MTVVKVFVSFEFERDSHLKNSLIGQAREHQELLSIQDTSLPGAYHTTVWVGKAREAIRRSDFVIVLIGQDTQNAPGVLEEVKIATNLKKPVIQIRPKGPRYGGVDGAGDIHAWKRETIRRLLGG